MLMSSHSFNEQFEQKLARGKFHMASAITLITFIPRVWLKHSLSGALHLGGIFYFLGTYGHFMFNHVVF